MHLYICAWLFPLRGPLTHPPIYTPTPQKQATLRALAEAKAREAQEELECTFSPTSFTKDTYQPPHDPPPPPAPRLPPLLRPTAHVDPRRGLPAGGRGGGGAGHAGRALVALAAAAAEGGVGSGRGGGGGSGCAHVAARVRVD